MPATETRRSVWAARADRVLGRIRGVRARVYRVPGGRLVWRVGDAVIGLAIIVVGIVLLPLPGPGWLIIFIGLGVWATEFSWARRLLAFARRQVGRWAQWVGRQPRWLQLLVAVGILLLCVAAAAGAWYLTQLI